MNRADAYRKLHEGQLTEQYPAAVYSAGVILDMLQEHMPIKTLLDVGCGVGAWVAAAKERGIVAHGVEGPWADQSSHPIAYVRNLEQPFDLERKYDVVTCIEVAEHIAPKYADNLVASLCRHADVIVFSAAIPGQGGVGHVNEQFLDYWGENFSPHNYVLLDLFRPQIWDRGDILLYLCQNCVAFVHYSLCRTVFHSYRQNHYTSIVHPTMYQRRIEGYQQEIAQLRQILQLLAQQCGVRIEYVQQEKGKENE